MTNIAAALAWLRTFEGKKAAALLAHIDAQAARIDHIVKGTAQENEDVCQTLGKALGYPWFKDDPKNFPDASEADGVCVGDHVGASLAAEAARKIEAQVARIAALEGALAEARDAVDCALWQIERENFLPDWDWLRDVRRRARAVLTPEKTDVMA